MLSPIYQYYMSYKHQQMNILFCNLKSASKDNTLIELHFRKSHCHVYG
jgi:hypothetical protein